AYDLTGSLRDAAELVLVAALGHTYAANPMRGIYRSTDGGTTWQQVLYKGPEVGAINLVADPDNQRTLFAGLEQHAPRAGGRGGFGAAAPATPGAGIYKSTDEGATWAQVTGGGLPAGDLGRIGLAVAAHTHGERVFAITTRGLYRSDDGGASWSRATADRRIMGSSYFSQVYVASDNPDVVYVCQTSLYRSTDGGHSFIAFKGAPGGDDYHEMWIDPTNSQRMILGVDQGATITLNGGQDWSLGWYNLANSQFYHIATDRRFPFWIYGTQQDSGSAAVASFGDFGETTFMDWRPSVGAYEFGYIHPDLSDPNFVLATGGGTAVNRYNWTTKQILDVTPPASGGWRYAGGPQVSDPHEPGTNYLGAQVVLASRDHGLTWQAASPDLTGGGRAAITALAPSPAPGRAFWVGTSDGLVQYSADGQHWQRVTPPMMPAGTPVEAIGASPHAAGTAYVAIERHAQDDFSPYIFRTRDGGTSWTKAVSGIPAGDMVRAVVVDPERAGLVYAGTERGVYVSFDYGERWQNLQLNLPRASVRDLAIQDNDLVAATYGRALWILDDLSPLRALAATPPAADAAYLFPPAVATRMQPNVNYDTPFPPEMATGENPPAGAIIDYYLPPDTTGEVTLNIYDDAGALVRTLTSVAPPAGPTPELQIPNYWLAEPHPLATTPGMHRVAWDLRYTPPPSFQHTQPIAALLHDTPSDPRGAFVAPGQFEVRLTVGGRTRTQPLQVIEDPRVTTSNVGLVAQRDLGVAIAAAMRASYAAAKQVASVPAGQLPQAAAALGGSGGRGRRGFGRRGGGGGTPSFAALNGQLGNLLTLIELSDDAPTRAMGENFQSACSALTRALASWSAIEAGAGLKLDATPAAPTCK
ncbi:MAG: glycoside hydrolase, partial [Terriglobales bacterium]